MIGFKYNMSSGYVQQNEYVCDDSPRPWAAPPRGTGGTGPPLSKVSGVQYPAILGEAGGPVGSRLYIIIRHLLDYCLVYSNFIFFFLISL